MPASLVGHSQSLQASPTMLGVGPMRLLRPKYCRARADEARAIADGMRSRESIQTMRRIADQYDELASRAERLAKVYPHAKRMDKAP
jgi:hypothetical protein